MFSADLGVTPVAGAYIEDVFSTYLYTGNGSTQTITNGIDLSGKGGLVWIKQRSGTQDHTIFDTARGVNNYIRSNTTGAQNSGGTYTDLLTAFNASGFSLGADASTAGFVNASGSTYASWTFRKQAKFFDVVTWTGDGSGNRLINHNLGSTPGCVIVKRTDTTSNWVVWHRSTSIGYLNTTAAFATSNGINGYAVPTAGVSTTQLFLDKSSGGNFDAVNASGGTYVAYLFAHDAGGFGAAGADNVISCGSFTTDFSGNATVSLGYEPQWVLVKATDATTGIKGNWVLVDNMRGFTASGADAYLYANTTAAEVTSAANLLNLNATGFSTGPNTLTTTQNTFIYIAIRRGPMKTPTTGTSVFSPITATASTGTSRTIGFPADMSLGKARTITANNLVNDRLRGYANSNTTAPAIFTNSTSAESAGTNANVYNVWNSTALDGAYFNSYSTIWYHFGRAPGFFDVVCYTGTNANRTLNHNLGVIPELIIVKDRSQAQDWEVYSAATGAANALRLNQTVASFAASTYWNNTAPTSSVFTVGTSSDVNSNGNSYVAYLFATVAGVSKVGSYTGTGALQTVNCGFTSGARFILIKRTDSTGDWWVYDSARGISSSTDPYLFLNSSAAEVTGTNYVDTASTGFQVTAAAPAGLNASGGTYIFLAIA